MTFAADRPPVVVDASVAVRTLTDIPAELDRAWLAWIGDGRMTLVPVLFWPEVANSLLRRHRLDGTDVLLRLEELVRVGLETADRGARGLEEAVDLAAEHGLTVYDALYLQLARDVDGSLATLDGDLARASRAAGVALEPIGPWEPDRHDRT